MRTKSSLLLCLGILLLAVPTLTHGLTSETKMLKLKLTSEQEVAKAKKQMEIAHGQTNAGAETSHVTGSTKWEKTGSLATKIIVATH